MEPIRMNVIVTQSDDGPAVGLNFLSGECEKGGREREIEREFYAVSSMICFGHNKTIYRNNA